MSDIKSEEINRYAELLSRLEDLEKSHCNVSLIFAELVKDEINANDEGKLYNGVKRVIRKYSGDTKAFSAIDEFMSVLCGGTSIEEILNIAAEEAVNPSTSTDITVGSDCTLHQGR